MRNRKPSPALIIALVALFISLGGGAYAAVHYRITALHQIKPSVRHELRGVAGPQGPPGATAAVVPPKFVLSTATSTKNLTSTAPLVALTVDCPAGQQAVSGGFDGLGDIVTSNGRSTDGQGWVVTAHLDPTFVPQAGHGSQAPQSAYITALVYCTAP